MNDFVNPQHRGVNLPAGFKDLMEVLDGKKKSGHRIGRKLRFQEFSANGLIHVEKSLDLFLNSDAEDAVLAFCGGRSPAPCVLCRGRNGLKAVSCLSGGDLVLERNLRAVFAGFGTNPSSESRNPDTGLQIVTYPVPVVRSQLLKVLIELLRRAFEVSDSDKLEILIFV